ncbi:MAG: hypothetical protein ACREM3_10630 [Candidatus Rokuibacteriota bacterium]
MIGDRTRLSLAQYLDRQSRSFLDLLFEKHGLAEPWAQWREWASEPLQALAGFLREVPPDPLQDVVAEIVTTQADLRDRVVDSWGTGATAYDARWRDLFQCLLLDGYAVENHRLVAIDPNPQGASHVEDALTAELSRSGLPNAVGIVTLLEQSAQAFRQVPPNYNACLSNVRAALQTVATEIAQARQKKVPGSFQADKWGQVLDYLRTSGLLSKTDEDLITSVYTFISPGAHKPVGLPQEEMVRLGRGMAVSACFFLAKLHNG